jgi:hypothetical protein
LPFVRLALALSCLAALCALAVPASAAAAKRTVWLCKPGKKDNPCTKSLTATVVDRDGDPVRRERTPIARRPKIDCFYVYPTVSGQDRDNATLRIDPEQRAVARDHASRFSQTCRVFAPMYRQLTLIGIARRGVSREALATGYKDVRDAWRRYLARHNHGRGVVLISHSQGTFVLRRLVAEEVEPKPAVRRRLVSALLLGGNVLVRKDSTTGGDFERIRACRSATQLGCVVAYSAFNETPPDNPVFGRSGDPDVEVLCTNPASLAGGPGALRAYAPTEHFPGILGDLIDRMTGPLPQVGTHWIAQPDAYVGRCVEENGSNVLMVEALQGARVFSPQPDSNWGLHLGDVNLAYGNLTELVRRQAAAYAARRSSSRGAP